MTRLLVLGSIERTIVLSLCQWPRLPHPAQNDLDLAFASRSSKLGLGAPSTRSFRASFSALGSTPLALAISRYLALAVSCATYASWIATASSSSSFHSCLHDFALRFVGSFVFLWRTEKLLISVPCFPRMLLLCRTHVESRVSSTAKSWFASFELVTRKLFPPTHPGESGVLRGGGPQVATCHIFLLAVCQSVVCGTILYPPPFVQFSSSSPGGVPSSSSSASSTAAM